MPRSLRKQLFKKVKCHRGGDQKSAKNVSRFIWMAPYTVFCCLLYSRICRTECTWSTLSARKEVHVCDQAPIGSGWYFLNGTWPVGQQPGRHVSIGLWKKVNNRVVDLTTIPSFNCWSLIQVDNRPQQIINPATRLVTNPSTLAKRYQAKSNELKHCIFRPKKFSQKVCLIL